MAVPLKPYFTKENAKEMNARSVAARLARKIELAKPPASTEPEQVRNRVIRQIEMIDERWATSPIKFWPALASAKARLWELLYPKPGSLKPRSSKRTSSDPVQPL